MSLPYLDTYIRAIKTQTMRNAMGLPYGYYAIASTIADPGQVLESIEKYFVSTDLEWTFSNYMMIVKELHHIISGPNWETIMDGILTEMYPYFKQWIITLMEAQEQ
jgi:hypothetical protein